MKELSVTLTHSGKQYAYKTARNLYQLGVLDKYITSGYIRPQWIQDLIRTTGNQFWAKRFEEGLPGKVVDANWRFEVPETIHKMLFGHNPKLEQLVYTRDVSFDKFAAKKIATRPSDIHYGFQGSCLYTLKAASAVGKTTICELATAHVTEADRLLREEAKLHPEWADTITNMVFPPEYEQRLQEEPFVADHVIVASEFSKQSLLNAGMAASKISTIPLGFELDYIHYEKKTFTDWENRPMRILFSGTVTQRKGIKYLLDAMQRFSKRDVELHIIGHAYKELDTFKEAKKDFHYHGAMSQTELFGKYKDFDLLVLPTIFEGFAMVIVEAMAAGLPVITTPHSIGPDVIDESANTGKVVPIRDIEALSEAIGYFKNLSGDEMSAASEAAHQASIRFTWDAHRNRLGGFLNSKLNKIDDC